MQCKLTRLAILVSLSMFFGGSPLFAAHNHTSVLAGVWQGKYVCAQGETAVTVRLSEADENGDLRGVFTFRNLPGKSNVSPGRFAISGSFDAGARKLEIWPAGWLSRPRHYVPVGFSADLDPEHARLTGRVNHHTCSSIELERVSG